MKEICTIGSQVWHVGETRRHLQPDFAFSYAFFNQYTGEVWAKRTVIEGRTLWIYSARDPKEMDLTIPIEWNEEGPPSGLLCALLVARVESLNQSGERK